MFEPSVRFESSMQKDKVDRENKLKQTIEAEIDLRRDAQRKEMLALKDAQEERSRLDEMRLELTHRDERIETLLLKLRDAEDKIKTLSVDVKRLEVEVSVRDESHGEAE